ncbi:MAG: Uma2 family endonuclease, partial [Snowella sp.]
NVSISQAITCGNGIKLVVEVVSSNWSDDYALKLEAYESLGIQEYWVVDYLGLGGRRFIGFPKQPTLTIYSFLEEQYQAAQFRQRQPIQSPSFPSLTLTAQEIFQGERD